FQERPTGDTKSADGNIQTEETALLNHSAQQPPEPTPGSSTSTRTWRQTFACPPQGFLALAVTNVALVALVWAVVWSITGTECLPGGNLFGIMFLYFFAVIGGKIFGLIKIRTLPPLPALLGKTPFLLFFLHSRICKLQSPQICSFSKRLVSAPLGEGAERRRLAQVKCWWCLTR
uniref:Solute carrier family 9 member B2 n=1 Tax=Anas platyrhynchos platyrhynchos TaxID=8840 RepID=A0A493TYS5_ANAPP